MSFSANVFNVLIASPSDVPQEREAIAASLHEWNALNSAETGKVLLPVMWESHSAPSMADRPQALINEQVVKSCDMLIGAFWTRLGTPTGVEDSGTVEEIKFFLTKQKPVMLYYSDAPIPRGKIDTKQFDKLEEFKASIRNKGIQEEYSSIDELKAKLSRQLTIVMRGMTVDTVVNAKVVKEAKASTKDAVEPTAPTAAKRPAPTKKSATKRVENEPGHDCRLEEYSDKSFVVRGDSTEFKDELKGLGGKWIRTRDGTYAWNFSKKKLTQVSELLSLRPTLN
jgi:nucleoside 2-deoxyribosyltransferase